MSNITFKLTYGVMLTFGLASLAVAQDSAVQPPSAPQQLQHIHTPQSIDEELVRLTKDLELTKEQQQQVKPLLQEHHNRIQALLDKNPNASRQELAPQIHAISADTHGEIHALLNDHQKQLEKAMQQREHQGEENRQPGPAATASPEPSPSAP
jgi:periplasmic protein CpxP/Spy